jgi:hypothetical protein
MVGQCEQLFSYSTPITAQPLSPGLTSLSDGPKDWDNQMNTLFEPRDHEQADISEKMAYEQLVLIFSNDAAISFNCADNACLESRT